MFSKNFKFKCFKTNSNVLETFQIQGGGEGGGILNIKQKLYWQINY